jgi:hypothetical protein
VLPEVVSLTVAVKVTLCPKTEGFTELVTRVPEVAWVIVMFAPT